MNVDPARLRFAPLVDHQTHLIRMQVADLFLDTAGVCAHTLASDALRAGVPLLALPRNLRGEARLDMRQHRFSRQVSKALVAAAHPAGAATSQNHAEDAGVQGHGGNHDPSETNGASPERAFLLRVCAGMARSLGLHAERVEREDQLKPAIAQGLTHRPALLDMVVTPEAVSSGSKMGLAWVADLQPLAAWDEADRKRRSDDS